MLLTVRCLNSIPCCHSTLFAGLTVKDTWDTKNVITSEFALDLKALPGNKVTFTKVHNNGAGLFE